MWFLDTTSELQLVNQRMEQTRREMSGLRFGSSRRRERRIGAKLDAGIVRLASGATRRQANRQTRKAA